MGATLTGSEARAIQKVNAQTIVAAIDLGGAGAENLLTNAMPIVPGAMGGVSVRVPLTVTNGVYSVGDVVGGLLTFPNAARVNGGHSLLKSVKVAGVVALAYELWLFTSDIATPVVDNGIFNLAVADLTNLFQGNVPIPVASYLAAANAFNVATIQNANLQVQTGAATTTLYGYLKTTVVTSPGTTHIDVIADFQYLD